MRTQFHHVIDVAPTILEAAGLPEPAFVNEYIAALCSHIGQKKPRP